MTPLQCLVVDDEPIARTIVENYLRQVPYLSWAGSCRDAFEAMESLTRLPVDLLILDINMPRLTGFEMLRSIKQRPAIIITSAYPQYALEGFELSVTDYLLKPFSFARFVQATEKVSTQRTGSAKPEPVPALETEEFLIIKSDKKLVRVALDSISFVEAYGNYIFIHRGNEKLISRQTLTDFETRLPAGRFVRVHKSYIVAVNAIRQLEGNELLVGLTRVPVGKVFKENLVRRLG
jgi:DNA-binding LytR/AlgR family response regulator